MQARHEKYLLELTGLPTATGREDRVIDWVHRWAKGKRNVSVNADRYGNLMLTRKGARSRKPIIFTAHMDHPAFVVVEQSGPKQVVADFLGGVHSDYFPGSRVRLYQADGKTAVGRVERITNPKETKQDQRTLIRFSKAVQAQAGDVLTWTLRPPRVVSGKLKAPACDDLAGMAAAIAAFEVLLKRRSTPGMTDVRVLLTRAEEVGFVGAIGACKSGIIPKGARLFALETSKSFADSPIGGGPIVRVGDRTSSFDPHLTYRAGLIAQQIQNQDRAFKWQRKLMTGGTCEASAYQVFGFAATCLCLALGNYHNMGEPTKRRAGRIESEVISLADYHGLIRLLVEIGGVFDRKDQVPTLKDRLGPLFARRRALLG